jgi:hypothetical protein
MSKKFFIGLYALLSACSLGTLTAGQAPGANLRITAGAGFLAIYGFPAAANETERPVGQGLGRNFGFGQNMIFQAGSGKGENLAIEIENAKKETIKTEACDSLIGGTLMSNRTGKDLPLSFTIHFADFQCNKAGLLTKEVLASVFADTQDRPWIAEICSPAKETKCKPDNVTAAGAEGLVKIENVTFTMGPGIVIQGTVWGKWENGAEKIAPCITLKLPPEAAVEKDTLYVTEEVLGFGITVGSKIKAIKGKACLLSANNTWYQQAEKSEPAIEIANE